MDVPRVWKIEFGSHELGSLRFHSLVIALDAAAAIVAWQGRMDSTRDAQDTDRYGHADVRSVELLGEALCASTPAWVLLGESRG
jgi:hypothetical protein